MSDHVYKTIEVTGELARGHRRRHPQRAVNKASETVRNLDWFEVVDDPRPSGRRRRRARPGHAQARLRARAVDGLRRQRHRARQRPLVPRARRRGPSALPVRHVPLGRMRRAMLSREYTDLYIDGRLAAAVVDRALRHRLAAQRASRSAASGGLRRPTSTRGRGRAQGLRRKRLGPAARAERAECLRAAGGRDQRASATSSPSYRRGDGLHYFLSDVYEATAPTLHWNYYAAGRRELQLRRGARVRPVGAGRRRGGRQHRAVRRQEPRRQGAGRRRGDLSPTTSRSPGVAQKAAPGARRRVHRGRQGARAGPARGLRDGRPDHGGGLPAGRDQHRRRAAPRRRSTSSAIPTSTWSASPARPRSAAGSARSAARSSSPCVLELGGKSAAIVLATPTSRRRSRRSSAPASARTPARAASA